MKNQSHNFENTNQNTNPPRLMTGLLWYVDEFADGSNSPMSLKEFKNMVERDEPSGKLMQGIIIPKGAKLEQQLIFDCVRTEDYETSTFKLLLNEDGTVSGKIEFPLYDGVPIQYFKGACLISKSEITIWGVLAEDFEFEKLHSVFIELKKIKNEDEELEYDEDEAVEFIRQNISDELNERLSDEDIVTLLDLDAEYIEIEYQKSLKHKPYLSFDLRTIDQDDVNDYVLKNAIKNDIILTIEEVDEIMYALIDYEEEIGLSGEEVFCLN